MKKIKEILMLSLLSICLFSCNEVLVNEEEEFYEGDQAATESTESTGSEIGYPEFFPEYSWDKVAVCLHVSNTSNPTEAQAEFMSQFPLICLEKGTGRYSEGSTFQGADLGVEIAAALIKSYSTDNKILCYQSFQTDYGAMYTTGSILDPTCDNPSVDANADWARLKLGEYELKSSTYRVFDQTNADARDWYIDNLEMWVDRPNIDGVFVDAYSYIPSQTGTLRDYSDDYGPTIYEDWLAGNTAKRNLIKERVSSRKLVLGNCIEASDDETAIQESYEYLESVGGGMMEHFGIITGDEDDEIVRAIQTISEVGKQGKMIVVKGWPRYMLTDDLSHLTQEELEDAAREDIVFPLAAFLCGAQKYAYFCYSWHYGYEQGSHILYDEYTKDLGEPLGEYVKDGYVFTREFEHASVWVDVKNREAKISWDE